MAIPENDKPTGLEFVDTYDLIGELKRRHSAGLIIVRLIPPKQSDGANDMIFYDYAGPWPTAMGLLEGMRQWLTELRVLRNGGAIPQEGE